MSTLAWTPPPEMASEVARSWRGFYRDALEKYGVTPEGYRDLYVAQHGCCYICRKAVGKNPDDPKGKGGRRLGIDHNHTTGAVRGLLCTGGGPGSKVPSCNWIIGVLTPEALRRAVEYVETEPAQAVKVFREDLNKAARDRGLLIPDGDMDGMLSRVLGLS